MIDTVDVSGSEIWANGESIKVKAGKGYKGKTGYRIELRGDYFYLEYGTLSVKWDREGTWFITLCEQPGASEAKGLCGDFNQDPMGKKHFVSKHFLCSHSHPRNIGYIIVHII